MANPNLAEFIDHYFEQIPPPKFQRATPVTDLSSSVLSKLRITDDDDDDPPPNDHQQQQQLFEILNCPALFPFLTPVEILSLWQTCRTTWNQCKVKTRKNIMLESVFTYLLISQESAEQVKRDMQGGWLGDFLARMVQFCREMNRIYWPYQPDRTHLALVAEKCCFFHHPRNPNCDDFDDENQGILLNWFHASKWPDGIRHIIAQRNFQPQPQPVPTLQEMHNRTSGGDTGCIHWGRASEGIVCDLPEGWWNANQQWMHENWQRAPYQYRERLKQGLDPIIWLMYDSGAETEQFGCGISPQEEQIIVHHVFYYETGSEDEVESFYTCSQENSAEHPMDEQLITKGILQFYIKYSGMCFDFEYDVHAGAILWAFNRGLIDKSSGPELQAALLGDAADDDGDGLELWHAMTSPLFGPANADEYTR